jgi:hypothetical protein
MDSRGRFHLIDSIHGDAPWTALEGQVVLDELDELNAEIIWLRSEAAHNSQWMADHLVRMHQILDHGV